MLQLSIALCAEVQEAGWTERLLADDERPRRRCRYGRRHRAQPTSRHHLQVQGDVAQSPGRQGTFQRRRRCPNYGYATLPLSLSAYRK